MWNRNTLIAALAAVVLLCCAAAYVYIPRTSELEPCRSETSDSLQIECIFRAIENRLLHGGIADAMQLFSEAYAEFPSFVAEGCHKQAHRVGDIVYYRLYIPGESLDTIDFPQETTACGYGFFHGFMEHLIQDRPDPAFVDETCTQLTERLGGRMDAIGSICFHGSGHGFSIANAELVPKSSWGSVRAFTIAPAAKCDLLTKATERAKEECKEGVFNMLVEWMSLGQYGFTLNTKTPFWFCDSGPKDLMEACYYETAQKLDGMADRDPIKLNAITSKIQDERLRNLAFQVGIAGIVQNTIMDDLAAQRILGACAQLDDDLHAMCLTSYIHGLFEHGAPGEEYKRPLEVCALETVHSAGLEDQCYEAISQRLSRFYAPSDRPRICGELPREYREMCESPR